MGDEEDDYMSDKFLTGLQDVRRSLVNSREKKRQIDVETKQKEHIKKQKQINKLSSAELDNERLQAALGKPLPQENKGFKLLAKMGYKPGQALGKSSINEHCSTTISNPGVLIEPIGITLKTDRQGLGREAALKELHEMRNKIRIQRLTKKVKDETSVEEFRRRANQKFEGRFIFTALKRCQAICENLDRTSDVKNPAMSWFWPDKTKEFYEDGSNDVLDDEDRMEEDTEVFSNEEKLEMLTKYVRTSHLFCYWCGEHYNDEQDLEDNCPGLTKDDH